MLAWPYLFKTYAVRDLAELLEIYGIPIRLGKYPSGAGDKEKAALLRAVTQLGHAAAGIIPDGMDIEFQAASTGTEVPFQTMYDMMERAESKAILGGTLTSQADGKSSTNALGNVHNEVRHDITASDWRQLSGTLTRDLGYSLLALNGGRVDDPRRIPRVVAHVREPEDTGALADTVGKLVKVGLPIGQEWAYSKFNVPRPQEGEPLLKAARASSAFSRAISICSALTAGLPAPPRRPCCSALIQLCSVCGLMSRILATAARLCPPLTIRTASSLNSNVYRALGLPISVPPCSSLNPQQGRHSSGATSIWGRALAIASNARKVMCGKPRARMS